MTMLYSSDSSGQTAAPAAPAASGASVRGGQPAVLVRPTLADTRESLGQIYGQAAGPMWSALLSRADLTGLEQDEGSLLRLLATMKDAAPVVALCAQSMLVRLSTFHEATAG